MDCAGNTLTQWLWDIPNLAVDIEAKDPVGPTLGTKLPDTTFNLKK
jgi:hypothetical protein